ncbi:MAG: protease SohB [Gammaproteobacteria bacterium]
MQYLIEYLLFAAKLATVVALVALPLLLALTMRASRARGAQRAVTLEVEKLNDALDDARATIEGAMLPPRAMRLRRKAERAARKAAAKQSGERPRSFVCHFDGDLRASAVVELREAITAVLAVARPQDELIVVLESGGGTVHGYGLAASQLARVREQGVRLRVVVDRIAASGGYMMACVGDEVIAAPFAIIGSIGVVAQLPNFHRLLQKHDIDYEQVTAGEFKRTLTLFGENTDAGRAKFREEIEEAHALFKDFIARYRPALDLTRAATGEWWFGSRALELGLVDTIATSDDIIGAAAREREVYAVRARRKRPLAERLLGGAGAWRAG